MAELFRNARMSTKTSEWSGVSCLSSEGETAVTPARSRSSPKSRGSEPATPRAPSTPTSSRPRTKSGTRPRGWRGSIQNITRRFTSKSPNDVDDQSPGKMKLVKVQHKNGSADKGPVKDQLTGMSKEQFHTSIEHDTMFQIASADVSKALKQAGYTVTGLKENLIHAAVDAAWGHVGKLSSECEGAKAQLEAVKARDVEMKRAHLREISTLRDQMRHVNTDSLKAIQDMSGSSEVENVQLYEPLNYLDADLQALVLEIVDEKLKELLTEDPDATVVAGKKLNHLAFNAFRHGRAEQSIEKYKEDNMKLREEVKTLYADLSALQLTSSSVLATHQEESRATQESLENDLAHAKQELKSQRSHAEGLSKELDKIKAQLQEALVRQNHYVAACQASFTQGQMETFNIQTSHNELQTSHDKLKSQLNQLYSDHVDLKFELQEAKRSEEEKIGLATQVRQLERQAEKEAARVRYLEDLFQMALSEMPKGSQSEDQFQKLVEGAVAEVDHDSNPVMLHANIEELRNALQFAESRSRQVGQEKRQLEAALREEKMSLLLNRAVNESLRPSGLRVPQEGSDDGNTIFETADARQHQRQAIDEFDDSARSPETQSTSPRNPEGMVGHHSDDEFDDSAHNPETQSSSTNTNCDTDFGLAAEDIKMDSQVRIMTMTPAQRMDLFAITYEDLMRISAELDGSDERTNELEAAAADAMSTIRQYQSREMQVEASSEEEHAKMLQEQMEQLQKALMHEVSHRRSLQEQYRIQEEKLMNSWQQVPSQSPMESKLQSSSPSPSLDSAKPPPSMTSLPSALQEARSVQALNEKLKRKEDVIKMKEAQIKMLLADNERMRTGSSNARAEVARLRAKLRMCEQRSAAAMGMHVGDSDEVSDSSLPSRVPTPVNNLSAHDRLYVDSSARQVKSGRQVDGVSSGGVVYQMDDGQEPASSFIATRPQSSASSRRKPPVTSPPLGKPKKEDFNAGVVGIKVHRENSLPEKNLLPEIKPTVVNESMNARRRPRTPQKLSVPQAATPRRHSAPDTQPMASLSVLPISVSEAIPGMINLAKSRPASARLAAKPR